MNVLVIAAHPDDETLGCGGTLLKHREAGDRVCWLVATDAHPPQWTPGVIARKAAEVERVAGAYGIQECVRLGLPAARLDTVPQVELIGRITEAVSQIRPALIYLVHGGDVHSDHRAVFTAAVSAIKPLSMARLGVQRILCYETLSSTEAAPSPRFIPHVFSEITRFIDQKLAVMALYETERQPDPMPRGPSAIRALARYRGATIGVDYAEAFMMIRERV